MITEKLHVDGPSEAKSEAMEEKAHSIILLCLADDVITEVVDEMNVVGLWEKLESLYIKKSLTNMLLLKQHLLPCVCKKVRL